jgi:O-antigen/teichoic acid export membrane protein
VLIISPWLAGHLYSHSLLSTLFNIYGCTLLVSAFSGVYEPILRIYDRFSAVVVPQILGSALTLLALLIYFGTKPVGYDLRVVVTALAVGLLLQVIPPFVKALRLVRPLLLRVKASSITSEQTRYRREFFRCLFNSNLSGYLKFAIDPGDIFLLGVFSSPTQVALYGLAQRLVAPLTFLQTTIQTAVVPEITTLVAKLQLEQLQRFVARYVKSAFAVGGILLLGTLVLGRLLLLHFFSANYAVALPVFYCLVIASWLLLVLLVFRPLAVSLDLLKWHNLALFVSAVLVAGLIMSGKLNALTMASVQLAEAAILRLAFSVLVWKRLRERKPAAVLFPG